MVVRCQRVKGENRLRVFRNRVPRGVFGYKGGDVTGEWGTLLEKLRDNVPFDTSNLVYQLRRHNMDEACDTCGGEEKYIKSFGGET